VTEVWQECPGCGLSVPPAVFEKPHFAPAGQPCAFVVTHIRRYMPDEVWEGMITSDDEEERVTRVDFGPDEESAVTQVVEYLRDEGLTEYSSYPNYQPHGWWMMPDSRPSGWDGNYTGRREELSAHLFGLTAQERMQVWREMREGALNG